MFIDTGILLIFLVLIGLSIDVGLTYHADHAIFLGVSPMETTYLLGIVGIFNILGKVTIGKLLDILHLWMFALTVIVMLLHCVAFSLLGTFSHLWLDNLWFRQCLASRLVLITTPPLF